MRSSLYSTLSLLVMLLIQPCWALEELGVLGSVEPARPYYETFLLKSKDQINNQVRLEPKDQTRIDQWSAAHSTYDSGLTPGSFQPIAITEYNKRIVQTLCFIANDTTSINWLNKHRSNLKIIQPICYLVRKDSDADITELQQTFGELNFVAVNPKFIIETYLIPHYPALVSKQGIEQ